MLRRNEWYKLSHNLSCRWRELFGSFFPGRHHPEPPPELGPGPNRFVLCPVLESSQDMPARLLLSGWEEPRHQSSPMDGAAGLGNMADQLELAEQIFLAALAVKPAERGALLDKLCGKNAEVRRTVEGMLADDERAGSFLEHPPIEFLDEATLDSPSSAGTTRTIEANGTFLPQKPAGRLHPGQVLNDRYVIVQDLARLEASGRLLGQKCPISLNGACRSGAGRRVEGRLVQKFDRWVLKKAAGAFIVGQHALDRASHLGILAAQFVEKGSSLVWLGRQRGQKNLLRQLKSICHIPQSSSAVHWGRLVSRLFPP